MKVTVYSQRDKSEVHELVAHVFSQQERTKRALIKFFSFFAIALASILVPVLHFVLVPLFLILAPFLAYKTYQEEVVIQPCQISCPECRQPSSLQKISGQWPLHNNCPHCRNRIYFDTVN